jgi:hypothetical protein
LTINALSYTTPPGVTTAFVGVVPDIAHNISTHRAMRRSTGDVAIDRHRSSSIVIVIDRHRHRSSSSSIVIAIDRHRRRHRSPSLATSTVAWSVARSIAVVGRAIDRRRSIAGGRSRRANRRRRDSPRVP